MREINVKKESYSDVSDEVERQTKHRHYMYQSVP